ncbi:alpha/beta fold hydrolase [Kutzneria buriramensis]|uniref:Pimeloyl-ACP methyl ester carboxylesterase n=1 Tax=Kutzneria buriramensis TaxID=1045776 RepID=A0A3E0HBG4_9PSEU|nr:alpha/beta hydrolase [Kutzneria buriramensis]REH41776.1 pimeloyl-ACP methyl ester carboxylesterase [Kutzneria buriramensis]
MTHFVDHGGGGPAVVLLHSFLMDGEMFAPQVAALGDAFRLVTVDIRGHGQSPVDGPFTYWDVANDVLEVLDQLGIDQFAAVGTSQGGFVAMRLALIAPERVTAIAVLGSSAAAEDPQVAEAYRGLGTLWATQGPTDQLLDMVATICIGAMDSSAWRIKLRALPIDRVHVLLNVLVDRDGLLDRLGEISCPALVLHGGADAAYPVERAEEIAAAVPKAEPVVLVEGGAHFLSLTNPDEVNPPLRAFLTANA